MVSRRTPLALPALYGCIILFLLGSAHAQETFKELKTNIEKSSLECYVCNSAVEATHCDFDDKEDFHDTVMKIKCGTDYLKKVYGSLTVDGQDGTPLDRWPRALSELAAGGGEGGGGGQGPAPEPDTTSTAAPAAPPVNERQARSDYNSDLAGKIGWSLSKTMPRSIPPNSSTPAYRQSAYETLYHDGSTDKGYRSCAKMRITIGYQTNGGISTEIKEENPRYIRTCSFVKPSSECKTVLLKGGGEITTCFCGESGCNNASYLRVSHWMILAVFLAILCQWMMVD